MIATCIIELFYPLWSQDIMIVSNHVCKTVWIQISTDALLVLICVQTVCKGYKQTAKVAASTERDFAFCFLFHF